MSQCAKRRRSRLTSALEQLRPNPNRDPSRVRGEPLPAPRPILHKPLCNQGLRCLTSGNENPNIPLAPPFRLPNLTLPERGKGSMSRLHHVKHRESGADLSQQGLLFALDAAIDGSVFGAPAPASRHRPARRARSAGTARTETRGKRSTNPGGVRRRSVSLRTQRPSGECVRGERNECAGFNLEFGRFGVLEALGFAVLIAGYVFLACFAT